MPKFKIIAKRITEYELEVEAKDEQEAYESMDDMIADDFEPHQTDNCWYFEIVEED